LPKTTPSHHFWFRSAHCPRLYAPAFIFIAALSGCASHSPPDKTLEKDTLVTAAPAAATSLVEPTLADPLAAIGIDPFDSAQPEAPPLLSATPTDPILGTDFWQELSQGFKLNAEQEHSRIDAQLAWYQKNQAYLDRVLERAEPWLDYIRSELAGRNLPSELALLPIVESAFDPFAYSHGRAAGIWQFIPGTAQMMGLRQNWWYDGRRDIVASTQAALDYLERMAIRFDGNWLYALAAYNAGPGNVSSAIKRNEKAGRPTDFWSLRLPQETQDYVPRLLALARITAKPERYGLVLRPIPPAPQFITVDIGSQIDLAQAADLAGIDTATLYRFNPGFNRWATDPDGPHQLQIPVAQAEAFQQALVQLPVEQRVQWRRYTIKHGDSLSEIASRHQTTTDALKAANGLRSHRIVTGRTLMIPTARSPLTQYSLSSTQRDQARLDKERPDKRKQIHIVAEGDSFWSIARRYGVNHLQIPQWNGMAPGDTLATGRSLLIWLPATAVAAAQSAPHTPERIRRIRYEARRGDSYASIAQRFGVSVKQLQQWNDLNLKKYLQPGDELILHVDIANAP
jgi:membrane-bound lytic murein transglycosylase D